MFARSRLKGFVSKSCKTRSEIADGCFRTFPTICDIKAKKMAKIYIFQEVINSNRSRYHCDIDYLVLYQYFSHHSFQVEVTSTISTAACILATSFKPIRGCLHESRMPFDPE